MGSFIELGDHYCYTNGMNMVAAILWWMDAVIYCIEWAMVHVYFDFDNTYLPLHASAGTGSFIVFVEISAPDDPERSGMKVPIGTELRKGEELALEDDSHLL